MIEVSTIDACSNGTQATKGWLNRLHMQRFEWEYSRWSSGKSRADMLIRAVVYVSEACTKFASLTPESRVLLDALVEEAKRFNRSAGVTGVLMFDGERFLQYMEGPMDGLSVAYSRVLGATSHHGLVELKQGRGRQRRLPYWPMRWLSLEAQDLRQLALCDWTRFNQRGDAQALNGTAMDRLVQLVEPYTSFA